MSWKRLILLTLRVSDVCSMCRFIASRMLGFYSWWPNGELCLGFCLVALEAKGGFFGGSSSAWGQPRLQLRSKFWGNRTARSEMICSIGCPLPLGKHSWWTIFTARLDMRMRWWRILCPCSGAWSRKCKAGWAPSLALLFSNGEPGTLFFTLRESYIRTHISHVEYKKCVKS